MKSKKYESIENKVEEHNTWCIGKVMEMSMINRLWIRVASCKRGDWRLLDKVFESKPIKREGKIPFWQFKTLLGLQKQMSS